MLMNKVVHRDNTVYGKTSTIILADGYAFVMITTFDGNPEVAIIHDLRVHKDRRGEGLGRELLEEAYKEAERIGAKYARLSVKKGTWAEEWYKRHGFYEVGGDEMLVDHIVLEKPCGL